MNFLIRSLTSFLYVGLLLGSLYIDATFFSVVLFLMAIIAQWELQRITDKKIILSYLFFPRYQVRCLFVYYPQGMGITKNAPNLENAITLMNYLLSEEAQNTYVKNSYEYSVNKSVKPSEIVQKWGDFRIDSLDLNNLGVYREDAIEVFETTGWK